MPNAEISGSRPKSECSNAAQHVSRGQSSGHCKLESLLALGTFAAIRFDSTAPRMKKRLSPFDAPVGAGLLRAGRVYLMANGDLRTSANQKCWPEQARVERILTRAVQAQGWKVVRAHPYDAQKRHGFIDSQKMGLDVFRRLDPQAPLIIAECVWQYSHHLLGGLTTHRGPILTVANWSGTWPGLVGLLNL